MTQHNQIVNYIEAHGSITPMEAFSSLGITKLSTRIGEIERDGKVRFSRTWESSPNRYGEPTRYMRYGIEWKESEQ